METGTALVPETLAGPGGTSIICAAAGFVAGELRRHGVRAEPTRLPAPRGSTLVSAVFGQRGLAVACTREDEVVARRAVDAWRAVAQARRVVLAAPRSFCAGVERAIDIVENALRLHGRPVYVRRQIVHNAHVVATLESRGAIFVDELTAVPDGAVVVFSAHGVAPAVREEADRRQLSVIDATCPLVAKVHSEARRFAARGDTVLLIGHDGHDEVEGTLGQLPGRIQLIQNVAEARAVEVADPGRVSYLTQTTLASDETADVLDALREQLPRLAGPGSADICYATTNRQEAVAAIAEECDLILVVGSANSSNSIRLVEVARRLGKAAHLIDDATDVQPEWLAGVTAVGLTAGASAPPHLVDEVVSALAGLGPVTVTERRTSEETVTFVLPPALRPS